MDNKPLWRGVAEKEARMAVWSRGWAVGAVA